VKYNPIRKNFSIEECLYFITKAGSQGTSNRFHCSDLFSSFLGRYGIIVTKGIEKNYFNIWVKGKKKYNSPES